MGHEPDLFAEMDRAADLLREANPELRKSLSDELQLEFRQLQKKRMPQLGKEEFVDLFHTWRDHYMAKLAAELAATRKRMAENDCKLRELVAELRRRKETTSSRDDVFVCRCGEVIADPFDPDMLALHGPHFVAASLQQVHEHLTRWRDYARGTVEAAGDLGDEAN